MITSTAKTDPNRFVTDSDWRTMRGHAIRRHPLAAVRANTRRRRGLSLRRDPPVGLDDILARLVELPISVWTYGFDDPTVRHLGPMAQDFARAFGLGHNDRRIELVDANGVVMAACQALHRRVVDLEDRLAALESS